MRNIFILVTLFAASFAFANPKIDCTYKTANRNSTFTLKASSTLVNVDTPNSSFGYAYEGSIDTKNTQALVAKTAFENGLSDGTFNSISTNSDGTVAHLRTGTIVKGFTVFDGKNEVNWDFGSADESRVILGTYSLSGLSCSRITN